MTRRGSKGCDYNNRMAREADERALAVLARYRKLPSLRKLGALLGVTPERVRQMVKRGERVEANAKLVCAEPGYAGKAEG